MAIVINEDTTFVVADALGDIPAGTELGLFRQDIRYLSRFELVLGGLRPLVLTARAVCHVEAVHLLLNPRLGELPHATLTLVGRRVLGSGLHECIEITSHADQPLTLQLGLTFDADFAHVFQVRGGIVGPARPDDEPAAVAVVPSNDPNLLRLTSRHGVSHLATEIRFSLVPDPGQRPDRPTFTLHLAPRGDVRLDLDVRPQGAVERRVPPRHGVAHQLAIIRTEQAFVAQAPSIDTDSYPLAQAYRRAVRDLAALRMEEVEVSERELALAAGIPWFMALFGRDSLITGYEVLPYLPQVASGSLRVLARLQGKDLDPDTEEEPGKILHEHRPGGGPDHQVLIPRLPYYGTIDATPLFLLLLAETYRRTADLELVRELWPSALGALEWLDRYGDRDHDGYLEYRRRGPSGLNNQGWKDSRDAIRFQDGSLAEVPIALCEVQGYAHAARLGVAELAEMLGEPELAARQRTAADDLRRRFNHDFWLPRRGTFALALDGQKRPVDALASNAGHCLWSGIAEPARALAVADRLLSPELFSGWGVRTMGSSEGGYNPIGYHTGSVWPHDTALIAAGLVRYGQDTRAAQLVEGLLAAAERCPDFRLPELFAGYGRDEYEFPVDYPTPCSPQAWAAGAVPLLITSMLGLRVDAARRRIALRPCLPPSVRFLRLSGLQIGDGELDVAVQRVDGELRTTLHRMPRGFKVEGTVFRWSIFW